MTNDFNHNNDTELRALFGGVTPPVADNGFSRRVIKRVQSSLWKRRAVLAAAAFVGLALAAPSITQLLLYAGALCQQLVAQGMALLKF